MNRGGGVDLWWIGASGTDSPALNEVRAHMELLFGGTVRVAFCRDCRTRLHDRQRKG